MKIALFHGSDLFYGSGTAVIYRRLLSELGGGYEVTHLVGPYRSDAEEGKLLDLYRREAAAIEPVFLPGRMRYEIAVKVSRRVRAPLARRWSARGYARQVWNQVRRLKPDLLWWSADYMPWSLEVLHFLKRRLVEGPRLHLSIYDPVGFWGRSRTLVRHYYEALKAAESIDVIGENLRQQLEAESGKSAIILNDFVEPRADGKASGSPSLPTVAITGQLYETRHTQEFLNLMSSVFDHSEIHWYGNGQNYIAANRLRIPANLNLKKMGQVPRGEVAERIRGCSFAYLNMPSDQPAFAKYSLPTKLVTYLEAELAVAFHAPEDSEVDLLNRRYGFGVNLLAAKGHQTALNSLISGREGFQTGLKKLIAERFEKTGVVRRLKQMLDSGSRPSARIGARGQ